MQAPHLIAGIDVGGTKVAVTVADQTGILHKLQAPVAKTGPNTAIAEQAWHLIQQVCQHLGYDRAAIQAVGISTCSPFIHVKGADGTVSKEVSAPNLCGGMGANPYHLDNQWRSFPLESFFKPLVKQVVMQNDAIATLQAERSLGAAQGSDHCVYATWSTGIGFGLCVDGHLLAGKRGNAGHTGHSYFAENDPSICGCGNQGDMEAMLSGKALARSWQTVTGDAQQDTVHLFQAARAKDARALHIVNQAAQRFAKVLYNLTVTLDVELFVLGGSVFSHNQDVLLPVMQAELGHGMHALTQGVRIVPAALGERTADLGALSLVLPVDWQAAWTAQYIH